MTKTKWERCRTYAEVWEYDGTGKRVRKVCETGSNSSPQAMRDAQKISALPKLLEFAEACKRSNPRKDEKVGQAGTFTITIHKNEWYEALKAIECARAMDAKLTEVG